MGITAPYLNLITKEHKFKALKGNLIVIGKQTIGVTHKELKRIFNLNKLSVNELFSIKKYDDQTRHAIRHYDQKFFFDHDVFKCISKHIKYNSLDRSKYEGAKYIQDMNKPLKSNLYNKFDIVIDGGSMDNLFNPVTFLINTSKMLKKNGRVFIGNHFFQTPGAYLAFSPEYYFSFFAVNNYKDVKIYIAQAKRDGKSRYNYKTELFEYKPYFKRNKNYDYFDAVKNMNTISNVLVFAEKGPNSTNDKIPCQAQYMDENEVDWKKKYFIYKKNKRKLVKRKTKSNKKIFNSDHFILLDSNF